MAALLLVLLTYWNKDRIHTALRDMYQEYFFRFNEKWKPYIEQNGLTLLNNIPLSICFVTLETRGDAERYVKLHNQSLKEYVAHQNAKNHGHVYTYQFLTKCTPKKFPHNCNPYWCKLFAVRELLHENQYDYVVWLDSDTVIANPDIDFANVLNGYQSHFFAGLDICPDYYDRINAGVFAFRNTDIGKTMIRALTEAYNDDAFQKRCVSTKDNKLRGTWALSCYEQGMMNEILIKRFREYTTVLPCKMVHNGNTCEGDFIIHLFDSKAETRARCFAQYTVPPTP